MPYKDLIQRKEYNKKYQKEYYKKNIVREKLHKKRYKQNNFKWYLNYKRKLFCEQCGETESCCLEFHHIDPDKKENDIGNMAFNGNSIKTMLAEIKKCKVLCSNCHKKLHNNN